MIGDLENLRFLRKYCGTDADEREFYCNAFSGCCGDKCCTEDWTFLYVWITLVICLIVVTTIIVCLRRRSKSVKYEKITDGNLKQNMQSMFEVVVVDGGPPFHVKMSEKGHHCRDQSLACQVFKVGGVCECQKV